MTQDIGLLLHARVHFITNGRIHIPMGTTNAGAFSSPGVCFFASRKGFSPGLKELNNLLSFVVRIDDGRLIKRRLAVCR